MSKAIFQRSVVLIGHDLGTPTANHELRKINK